MTASTTALNTLAGSLSSVVPLSTIALSVLYWKREKVKTCRVLLAHVVTELTKQAANSTTGQTQGHLCVHIRVGLQSSNQFEVFYTKADELLVFKDDY